MEEIGIDSKISTALIIQKEGSGDFESSHTLHFSKSHSIGDHEQKSATSMNGDGSLPEM